MTESTAITSPTDHFCSGVFRGRRSLSFNSSSAHFTSAAAAATSFGSPSPRHSAIPFSWERSPGIPRSPKANSSAAGGGGTLPLPPLFRSHSDLSTRYGRYRSHGRLGLSADDPFAVALWNCAKGLAVAGDEGEEMVDVWDTAANARRRRGEMAGRFGFRLSRFYVSCKGASAVATAEATVRRVRRSGSVRGPVELIGVNVSRASVIPGPS